MADPVFISRDEKDLCVICSAVTPYHTNTDVKDRQYYVEGLGQLCVSCGKKDKQSQDFLDYDPEE